MKKTWFLLLALVVSGTLVQAEMKCAPGKCGGGMMEAAPKKMMQPFQSVAPSKAVLLQKGDAKAFCPNCGMNLAMFYKTSHAATVGGETKQYCSLHCLAEDIQKGLNPADVKVVDVTGLTFIDADKAFYVVGSAKPATMSMVSKYAFADKAAAETFAKENGGEVMDFQGALQKAQDEFAKDSSMVAGKQEKMAQMGKMIYEKQCQKTDKTFASTAQAKAYVEQNNLCEGLDGKALQAVGLYLGSR